METLIDEIVSKLQSMPVEKLETALALISSLEQQEQEKEIGYKSEPAPQLDKQAQWRAFVNEYSGIWPDLPLAEELRAGMGEDLPRESF